MPQQSRILILAIVGWSLALNGEAFDLRAVSATSSDSARVTLVYDATGVPPEMMTADAQVWRSADPVFDPDSDALIASEVLDDLSAGVHTQDISIPGPGLDLRAALPYVFVIIDPGSSQEPFGAIAEDDETNNQATFRKYTLAVLVHGLTFLSAPPSWVHSMGTALMSNGYDDVIEADWVKLSRTPIPGAPQEFAAELLPMVFDRIVALDPGVDDRIDVHWIAHSRGNVVISQVLLTIAELPDLPASIGGGWQKVTLLDPHPAKNRDPERMSINRVRPLGLIGGNLVRLFQSIADDPDVVIPRPLIDEVELYFQHNEWYALSPFEVLIDYLTNLWGETSIEGVPSELVFDVTQPGLSHYDVPDYYTDNVLSPPATNAASPPWWTAWSHWGNHSY